MTANLHTTVKQQAAAAGVSVRMIYLARQLIATGRDDLVEKVRAGGMTMNRALIEAGAKPPPDNKSQALFAAWNLASDAERQAFIDWLSATRAA